MDNVTGLSTRPKILINGNDASDSGGSYESGTINVQDERYNFDRQSNVYRRERFVIDATIVMHDQNNDTIFRAILAEIDRVLGTQSFVVGDDYDHYSMTSTVYRDRGAIDADLVFVMIKELQAVNV